MAKKNYVFYWILLLILIATPFYFIIKGFIWQEAFGVNAQDTIDTSNGTHLWLMSECAGMLPSEIPTGYSDQYIANNFDVFVVGGGVATYRLDYILSHIQAIKSIKPNAKFTFYSNFNQLQSFTDSKLNDHEFAFSHSTDPASLILIPQANKVTIDWNPDNRRQYTPFLVTEYRIYKGTSQNSLSLLTTTLSSQYVDSAVTNGQTYYYKVVTVGNDVEYDYSFTKSVTPSATAPAFFLIEGGADVTVDTQTQIYNVNFYVDTPTQGDSAFVYVDLNNDWQYSDTEKFAMTWTNGRYETTQQINLRAYRSWVHDNVVYGLPYFFQVNKDATSYNLPADGRNVNNVYTTTANNRAKHRIYGEWNMRLNSQDWQDWYVDYASKKMNAETLDGIYIDEPRVTIQYYTDVRPIDLTQNDIDTATRQLANRLSTTFPNKLIFYNSLDAVNLNSNGLDGGLLEGYGLVWGGAFDINTWIDHQNKIIESERTGLSFMLPVDATDNQRKLFLLSSYYLIKSDGSYYWVEGWDCPTVSTMPKELLAGKFDLGFPIGSYPSGVADLKIINTNLYLRNYTNGMVLVNPSTTSYTYNLGSAKYNDLVLTDSGLSYNYNVTGTITVLANTGRILENVYIPMQINNTPINNTPINNTINNTTPPPINNTIPPNNTQPPCTVNCGGGGGGSPVFSPLFKGSTPPNNTNSTTPPIDDDPKAIPKIYYVFGAGGMALLIWLMWFLNKKK